MVPAFAILFGPVNTRFMWRLEQLFYRLNGKDSFLFDHFERLKLSSKSASGIAVGWLYRGHPFFAGISLLLSYMMVYTSIRENFTYLCVYLFSSTVMAYCGGSLTPTMYGDASAKRWTLRQSRIVYVYNVLTIVAMVTGMKKLQEYMFILSFMLLVCAGVGERFYVLFVLPWFGFTKQADQDKYLKWYSIQFKSATIASWMLSAFAIAANQFFG